MASLRPLVAAVWGAALLMAASPAAFGDETVSPSTPERPAWVTSLPDPPAGRLQFRGVKTKAATIEEGKDGAYRDAAVQAVNFIMSRISIKSYSFNSSVASRVYDEIRSAPRGAFQGARQRDIYWIRTRSGRGKKAVETFDVWVLVEMPAGQVRAERERLERADQELREELDRICLKAGGWLKENRAGLRVQVSGFKDAASGERFPFSSVLEDTLRGCLPAHGAQVVSNGRAEVLATGSYWQSPGFVAVSVKLLDGGSGAVLHAQEARLPLDAVEPFWLKGGDEDASFFAPPSEETVPRPRTGGISVKTVPPGARIFVDGVDRGLSPSVLLGVAPGVRSLALGLKDHVPYSQEVAVEPDQKAAVAVNLKRETGRLSIRSAPSGAAVLIDGSRKGQTPFGPVELPTGRYQVGLKLKDHKPWSTAVAVAYDKTELLEPQLVEEDGSLFVLIEPEGADIRFDGMLIGQSSERNPVRLQAAQSGAHEVSAHKPGFTVGRWPVRVRPHRTTSVSGRLSPQPPEAPPRETILDPWSELRRKAGDLKLPRVRLGDRPDKTVFVNILGATLGGNYNSFRVLEAAYYFWDSRLGLGTCVASGEFEKFKLTRTDSRLSFGVPSVARQQVDVGMFTLFPLQLYAVPLAHQYSLSDHKLVSTAQVYLNLSYWAMPVIKDGVVDSDQSRGLPMGSIVDYGILLHTGAFLGLRVGTVETRLKSFTFANSSYPAINDRKVYVAADVSLGFFKPLN